MSLFRRSESRSMSEVDFPWYGTDSVSMDADGLLSIVPAFAAVNIISETIATLPLHQFTRATDGTQSPMPLSRVIDKPVDGSMPVDWVQRCAVSMLTNHGAVGLLSGSGLWPEGCTWINPARLTAEMKKGTPSYWLDGRSIDPNEFVYIPSMVVPGQPLGVSRIGYFAETFSASREAQAANRNWAKSRAVPGSKLKNTQKELDPVVAEALSDRAADRIRNGKPFVYGKDWEFDVLSIPAGDVAFLDSIKANATQIAAIYNIPPEMIGGETGNSLTYSTVEQNTIKFLTFTIRPLLKRIEDALSRRLLPEGQMLKFNADALIRVDTATRYATYKTARDIGLLSLDEIRSLEDRTPLPDGQGATFEPISGGNRNLSAAEVSQKVYLAVINGVLSRDEGRQLIAAAGGITL